MISNNLYFIRTLRWECFMYIAHFQESLLHGISYIQISMSSKMIKCNFVSVVFLMATYQSILFLINYFTEFSLQFSLINFVWSLLFSLALFSIASFIPFFFLNFLPFFNQFCLNMILANKTMLHVRSNVPTSVTDDQIPLTQPHPS